MDSDIHETTDVCDTRLSLALAGGEVEAEKVSPARPSTDEEEVSPRKKLRLTNHQSALLEDTFKLHTTLTPSQKQALANQLNLRPRQVEVWFQNRRARTKLKQTETECEMMKKRWEQLAEDNKRLRYELYRLKLVSVVCPSCNKLINSSLNN